jgi:hypothetical protein
MRLRSSNLTAPMRSALEDRTVAILARAERDGFLTEDRSARHHGEADREWTRRCFKKSRPYLAISQNLKTGSVILNLDTTDRQLTGYAMKAIARVVERLLRALIGRRPSWTSIAPDEVWVDLPWEHAPAVARALLAIIRRPGALDLNEDLQYFGLQSFGERPRGR